MVSKVARSGTPEWFAARRQGVSATSVARAAASKLAFDAEVEQLTNPVEIADNAYMKFGRDWEEWLVSNLPKEYEIVHNDWLVARDGYANRWQLATPDGNNADWTTIAEVKTTGKDWEGKTIPIQYRRQVQWQIYVAEATRCIFAWLLRVDGPNGFQPGWFEPKHVIIERDDEMISQLVKVAERLQMATIYTERMMGEKNG